MKTSMKARRKFLMSPLTSATSNQLWFPVLPTDSCFNYERPYKARQTLLARRLIYPQDVRVPGQELSTDSPSGSARPNRTRTAVATEDQGTSSVVEKILNTISLCVHLLD
ncbi:hypothetical protein M378DRAFT_628482 [Amanita muscaria Koide BX008]|uniref:Uncharacterized protein n=1 Tax=Amanita muscaria (strain Koide BX008) TaxID=946122 RepID=A0A0C2X4J7_AMAMK|nr:hypothetical protein M378DRAFT_628482 [Amanita muscaria Koide BX008]